MANNKIKVGDICKFRTHWTSETQIVKVLRLPDSEYRYYGCKMEDGSRMAVLESELVKVDL